MFRSPDLYPRTLRVPPTSYRFAKTRLKELLRRRNEEGAEGTKYGSAECGFSYSEKKKNQNLRVGFFSLPK
jgi:hypothetical protein